MKLINLIICFLIVTIITSNVHSKNNNICNKEVKIITNDNIEFTGKIITYSGGLIIFNDGDKVSNTEVKNIFEVKRKTKTGILIGCISGFVVSTLFVRDYNKYHDSNDGFLDFNEEINSVYKIIGGTLLGGGIGGLIGRNIITLDEINIEATPFCISPANDMNLINLKLSYNL